VGIARGAFELARQHALNRVQGGGLIAQHQMVRHMLADMATQIEAARLLTHKAAMQEPLDTAVASMAKVFASDTAVKVATDTVQIMGAFGTTLKSGAEKYYRDAKMTQIFEGTNELCRLAITDPILQDAGLISPAL
jgi:alkylation response protein AidB-like acyl-CoA dehydrogenase